MNQFKKTGLIIIGLFLTLDLIGQQNVSKTGFYEGDSVFFKIKETPFKNGSIEIIVNSFSDDYQPYKGGFWLYNRNYEANTWENQNFTKYEDYPYDDYIDSLTFITKPLERGQLKKVNIIKARFLDESGKVQNEKVYFIGVNGKDIEIMHDLPVIHIYVDSIDAFGPEGFYGPGKGELLNPWFNTSPDVPFLYYGEKELVWNYNLSWADVRVKKNISKSRIEKESFIEIIDENNNTILDNQKVGIRLTGNGANNYFNKGMQVLAKKKYGNPIIKTDLFNRGNEEFKNLRIRVGGSAQDSHFGYNELGLSMADGLKIGEANHQLAVLYLNGSYWSLTYIQEKLNIYLIGKTYNTNPKNIDLLNIERGWGTFSLYAMGDSLSYIDSANYAYIPIDSTSKVRIENMDVIIPLEYDSFFTYHTTPYHDPLESTCRHASLSIL